LHGITVRFTDPFVPSRKFEYFIVGFYSAVAHRQCGALFGCGITLTDDPSKRFTTCSNFRENLEDGRRWESQLLNGLLLLNENPDSIGAKH
jgi:hypothetical protein